MIKLPNKLYSYNESIISKFAPILKELECRELTVLELYSKFENTIPTLSDFIDTLCCLYALDVIEINKNRIKFKGYA